MLQEGKNHAEKLSPVTKKDLKISLTTKIETNVNFLIFVRKYF